MQRQNKRETKIFHLLAHFPNSHNSLSWTRPKPLSGFPTWVRGTQNVSRHLLHLRHISRNPDGK